MARLTVSNAKPGEDPYAYVACTLADLMRSTPALTILVLPDDSVGVWVNPEVAAKVDTEDCERMVGAVRKVLLACVRPQG